MRLCWPLAPAAGAQTPAISASVTRIDDLALRAKITVRAKVKKGTNVRIDITGCQTRPPWLPANQPDVLICGVTTLTRRVRLSARIRERSFRVRAQRLQYEEVPDGAGLGPYKAKLAPEPIDSVAVLIHGRQRVLLVKP